MGPVAPASRSARFGTSRPGIVVVAFVLGLSSGAGHAFPQPAGQSRATTDQTAAAQRWFADAKLGLFIHWGVYSLLGKGEWVMDHDKIPISEYAKLPPRFKPVRFDAEAWVKLARSAGAKYITITSKHHDGFCMFASRLTDYDVVDATPDHVDRLKALADACHQEKIKLFFYYSLLDWHHPDYYPLGKTGQTAGREAKGDWKRYVAYYQGQVRELCTNYGAIGGIWFDGWWDKPDADWDLAGTYRLIHELQPGALVGNNHHVEPLPGEDFQIFEQDVPGENAAGFNKAGVEAKLPLETCLTINQSWGFNPRDTAYKSSEQTCS
jgi:alpha-L-fucosidase